MLPSINHLADGSDNATVRALAGTVALLLGGVGLQDSFYTDQSSTRVLSRLEGVEGADAERVEPALTALKHLRDVSPLMHVHAQIPFSFRSVYWLDP